MNKSLVVTAMLLGACAPAMRQTAVAPMPPVAREFRGVWVATVSNIDWPSRPGLPADSQKKELLAILDRVQQMRMNAVVLQVRPGADALYDSKLEPWSEYLTGTMGKAPEPYYDPLAFAVAEAHKRGLELHAWFNPYRAHHPSASGPISATHISKTRPDIVRTYGKHLWMDPGELDVRAHSVAVILDVVKRYDIDGVHIDDYFYPYQERDSANRPIPFPDDASYAKYLKTGGKLKRDDWRRHNVDLLVEELYHGIKATKPWVKFGVSPFGIWRPGYPEKVKGFDAYASLYADSRKWLKQGWVDYWTPQLYWQINAPDHGYTELLDWWVGENAKHRHVWPGNGLHQIRADGRSWQPGEAVRQIAATRAQPGASGNIHFSMRTFMRNSMGIVDTLKTESYNYFALPPRSQWLDKTAPPLPVIAYDSSAKMLRITRADGEAPMWYAVRLKLSGAWYAEVIAAGETEYPLYREPGVLPEVVAVTAIDRSGNESLPSTLRLR